MAFKSYKFRFYPNVAQRALLQECFGVARFAYNQAIYLRSTGYSERGMNVSNGDVSAAFTELKKDEEYSWLGNVPVTVITQSLADSDKAYDNFFKRRTGYPKYKSRYHAQACRMHMDQRQKNFTDGTLFKLPKLGNLKLRWSQKVNGRPKMATVKRDNVGRYYVCFMAEEQINPLPKTNQQVGIDLGISHRAALSNGNFIDLENQTRRYEKRLARAQKVLARKQKGSNNRERQRIKVARIHSQIANARLDAIHKFTTQLVREFDVIAVETLKVKNMVKNRKLAKSLHDASFGTIVQLLEYKAEWYGKQLIKIDQWFPSTQLCSSCGTKNKMLLSDRTYNCSCGTIIDRDTNAALNILAEGIRSLNVEGLASVSVSSAQKQVGPMKHKSNSCDIIDECYKAGAEVS